MQYDCINMRQGVMHKYAAGSHTVERDKKNPSYSMTSTPPDRPPTPHPIIGPYYRFTYYNPHQSYSYTA